MRIIIYFKNNFAGLLMFIPFLTLSIGAQSGGPYTVTKSMIAGGGGRGTGGTYAIDGTTGQPVAGTFE